MFTGILIEIEKNPYLAGVGVDITDRKNAEKLLERHAEELQKNHEQSLALFNGIDDVIYVADPETYELLFVNDTFQKVWGEDVLGKKCYAILQNRKTPCPFCTNDKILGEYLSRPYVWEFQNQVTGAWFRCADKAIQWPDGRMVRFELASDITAQKLVTLELAVRNRIAEIFLAGTDDKIYTDILSAVLDAMGSKFGVFGYIDDDGALVVPTMTRTVWDQCAVMDKDIVFPESTWGCSSWVRAIREKQMNYTNERSTLPPEGHIPIERHVSLPILQKEKVIGLIQVANKETDYTENDLQLLKTLGETIAPVLDSRLSSIREERFRKKAQEQLKQVNENLARSNKELEQFAYVASHDLQEPLRMVASYVQLLERRYKDKLDQDALDFIHYAVDGATRMKTLINDLLMFSRVETKGKPLAKMETEVAVKEATLNLKTLIDETGTVLTCGELPEIIADKGQMTQLFQNLIANAIKYRSDEIPKIDIAAQQKADKWIFSIKDNGIGIDPQFFDRIFIIFQQLHGKGEDKGTGIGLAICKRIVERHGGDIWLESEPGKGTTFYFTLAREINS